MREEIRKSKQLTMDGLHPKEQWLIALTADQICGEKKENTKRSLDE